jgi:hypothetical protein
MNRYYQRALALFRRRPQPAPTPVPTAPPDPVVEAARNHARLNYHAPLNWLAGYPDIDGYVAPNETAFAAKWDGWDAEMRQAVNPRYHGNLSRADYGSMSGRSYAEIEAEWHRRALALVRSGV